MAGVWPESRKVVVIRRAARLAVSLLRWWFGLVWIAIGIVGVVWSGLAFSRGDSTGVYLLVGGVATFALGWAVHPWGLSRTRRERDARG